jgi:crotonobetainyl-CoA:carnitine CoA-transferase CaiB-like acyl-CoA transferase
MFRVTLLGVRWHLAAAESMAARRPLIHHQCGRSINACCCGGEARTADEFCMERAAAASPLSRRTPSAPNHARIGDTPDVAFPRSRGGISLMGQGYGRPIATAFVPVTVAAMTIDPATSSARQDVPRPLSGVRVLEFCHTIMGPSAGMLLADLGADVIKIEPAPDGDKTRRLRGFAAGFFYAFNRNKRSLAVDLKSSEGRDLIHRLAAKADVVLENYGPGTMERLGCGYADLAPRNPRLIYCALKGFLSGPYEHRPALDEVVQFMAGLAYMTGPPGQPLRAGSSVIDIMGGMFAVIGIQAALAERERTGRGQLVKSALFETTAFLMTQHMAGQAVTGRAPPPMPAREGAWGIYDLFATADGHQVFVGLTSDNQWKRFCEHFQRSDLLHDPRYATNQDRVRERPTLKPIVAQILQTHPLAALTELFDRIDIPFSPVARPGDLFDDPQLNAHGRMLTLDFPEGVQAKMPRLPIEIGNHDFSLVRQAPTVGEHTADILMELGLSEKEIAELARREIIALPQGAPA